MLGFLVAVLNVLGSKKPVYTCIILGMGMLLFSQVSAQVFQFSGTVLSQESKQGIPYATLRVRGHKIATITNQGGDFSLKVPLALLEEQELQLEVSSIGFEALSMSLTTSNPVLEISLTPKPYQLGEVFIYDRELNARDLLKEALRKIPENYIDNSFTMDVFYRHYCKEGGQYGRLIEAAAEIAQPGGYTGQLRSKAKNYLRAEIKGLRRSFDFTRFSTFSHLPIALYQTMEQDVARYHGLLGKSIRDKSFEVTYLDATSWNGEMVWVILCEKKGVYRVKSYVLAHNLAIVRVETEQKRYFPIEGASSWRTQRYVMEYRQLEDRYHLSFLKNQGDLLITYWDSTGTVSSKQKHQHDVSILVNSVRKGARELPLRKEPDWDELAGIPYQPTFWESYNIIKASPVEEKAMEDLGAEISLPIQFKEYNQPSANTQDFLASIAFQRALKQYKGRYVLVYWWSPDKIPSIKDIIRARKIFSSYEHIPVSWVFIGCTPDEAAWRKGRKKQKLFGGFHIQLNQGLKSDMATKQNIQSIPFYEVYSPTGEKIWSQSSLPKPSYIATIVTPEDDSQ
ncbi:MAG: carboxypeptidase-like regulatory domain-containing protein [Bacteroidota bacterium]